MECTKGFYQRPLFCEDKEGDEKEIKILNSREKGITINEAGMPSAQEKRIVEELAREEGANVIENEWKMLEK